MNPVNIAGREPTVLSILGEALKQGDRRVVADVVWAAVDASAPGTRPKNAIGKRALVEAAAAVCLPAPGMAALPASFLAALGLRAIVSHAVHGAGNDETRHACLAYLDVLGVEDDRLCSVHARSDQHLVWEEAVRSAVVD